MPRLQVNGEGSVRVAWGFLLALFIACGTPAQADNLSDDPPFLSVGGGYVDPYRQRDTATEFRVEYRHDYRFWLFKPFLAASANTDNAFHLMAGVLIDIYFGDRWVVTPSFAPGYYDSGDGLNLGHHVEFRSQLEIAYRFDNRARLGVGYSHTSNAHLSNQNPGSETAFIMFSIPLTGLK
jgi:lipid A 3-O-deacylase